MLLSPVISPTVAICGCAFARNEKSVEPENGGDMRYTKGKRFIVTMLIRV